MHSPILTRVEFERMVIFFLKILFLKPNFHVEGRVYAKYLFDILHD